MQVGFEVLALVGFFFFPQRLAVAARGIYCKLFRCGSLLYVS